MTKSEKRFLVADIGGTHARFAYSGDSPSDVGAPLTFETHSFTNFDDALREFLDETGHPDIAAAAICGAGPIVHKGKDRTISLTNCPWVLSETEASQTLQSGRVSLVNDFAAVAFSVPLLGDEDVRQVGAGRSNADGPIAVMGAGTGLGVAGLMPHGKGNFLLIDGEGGHADLAPANARELAVFDRLLNRFGCVEAETILSGSGLEALHDALCELDGLPRENIHAAEIAARAATGGEAESAEAVQLFASWLGAAAANVALIMGATGGVYIAGGIVPKWGGLFDASAFRTRFEARGKMADYLKEIPTFIVTAPDPALKGLADIARRL